MKRIHIISKILWLATVLLIGAGGLVTSTHSGLSVPDWPLSYGSLNPPMVGGIIFEHSHRMIAGLILLGTLFLSCMIFAFKDSTRKLKMAALILLLMVSLQAVLGGLTVLLKLPPLVSVAHACLAQLFLSVLLCVACKTSSGWCGEAVSFKRDPSIGIWIPLLPIIFFTQLLSGAFLRHTDSPTMLLVHIAGAFFVVVMLFVSLIRFRMFKNDYFVKKSTSVLAHGIFLQFFLGVTTYILLFTPHLQYPYIHSILPTFHQTFGAILLASTVLLSVRINFLNKDTQVK